MRLKTQIWTVVILLEHFIILIVTEGIDVPEIALEGYIKEEENPGQQWRNTMYNELTREEAPAMETEKWWMEKKEKMQKSVLT